MKTTVDLPDALVREIKLRALYDGQKLKDAIADLLRKGLKAPPAPPEDDDGPGFTIDPETRLPLIPYARRARPSEELTANRIHEILLQQEVDWYA
ncbi:MAG: hypothetical protein ABIQ47_03940 [Tepidiformaceae bacterium]